MRNCRRIAVAAGALLAAAIFLSGTAAQRASTTAKPGDWPSYRGGPAGTGYSALTQIGKRNIGQLRRAWTYSLQAENQVAAADGRAAGASASQATPIVIDGTMYLPTADAVVALDADSGRPIWKTPLTGGAPSRRGVAYWPGTGADAARIFVMSGRRLLAFDPIIEASPCQSPSTRSSSKTSPVCWMS